MATVKFGPLVTQVAGSVAGVTFNRTLAGYGARRRPYPPKPIGPAYQLPHAYLQHVSTVWRSSIPAFRQDWIDYAETVTLYNSVGDAYHPTGFNTWVWNALVQAASKNGGFDSIAPDAPGLPSVPLMVFDYNAHNIRLVSATPPIPAVPAFCFASFIVYAADVDRKFRRTRVFSRTTITGATAVPAVIAAAYDAACAVGDYRRAHIEFFFYDANRRMSTRQRAYLDFLVA